MLYAEDRRGLRESFVIAWRKHRAGEPLSALEAQIAAVIAAHVEYHTLLEAAEDALNREFHPEDGAANPFLHMALHLAVRDQLDTDRPAGIRNAFERAIAKTGDRHPAEHLLLECLAAALWQSQRDGVPPDNALYLRSIEAQLAGHSRNPPIV